MTVGLAQYRVQLRILVADDDGFMGQLICDFLRGWGHTVTMVEDGPRAQDALGLQFFDLVVTDWMMPKLDGIELTRWIRRQAGEQPRVLLISSMGENLATHYASGSGVDGFLKKPVKANDLRAAVEQLFLNHEPKGTTDGSQVDD